MNVHDYLGDDGQALLLLGTAFALAPEIERAGAAPFKLSEWNQLSKRIGASPLQRPSALLGKSADEISGALKISGEEAERIVTLLGRAGRAALEIESLFSRGLWVITRVDAFYPAHLRHALKQHAPAVIFGAGEVQLLAQPGLAIVGSRNVDEAGAAFAQEVARKAVASRVPVISGGARGTDRIAMQAALDAGGISLGVLADSLDRTARQPDVRQFLIDRQLVLVTPYLPGAGFSVGGAMGRNKFIYGLARHAAVISSEHDSGGTWAGAVEALKNNYAPVFVRDGANVPKGNRELLKLGAVALNEGEVKAIDDLPAWMSACAKPAPVAADLFDFALHDKSSQKASS